MNEEIEIQLDDNVYDALVSYAAEKNITINEAVNEILRRQIEKVSSMTDDERALYMESIRCSIKENEDG
jgi:hypothetical protein